MNVRRGLFRLWVVAAIIWACVSIPIAYTQTAVIERKAYVYVKYAGLVPADIDDRDKPARTAEEKIYLLTNVFSYFDPPTGHFYVEFPNDTKLAFETGTPVSVIAEVSPIFEKAFVSPRNDQMNTVRLKAAGFSVAVATVPAVIVFIAGWAAFWVAAGFRQQRQP